MANQIAWEKQPLAQALRRVVTIMVMLMPFWTFSGPLASAGSSPHVVMVLVDDLTIADFNPGDMPSLVKIAARGGVGVMTTNTAGTRTIESGAVSIGAGLNALSPQGEGTAFDADEYTGEEFASVSYKRRTSRNALPGNVVVPGAFSIYQANRANLVRARPGTLGEALHQAGMTTAVIGNADVPRQRLRSAPLLAMDTNGLVDYGDVSGEELLKTDGGLLPWSDHHGWLLKRYRNLSGHASLVVIELGDLYRLDQELNSGRTEVISRERLRLIRRADAFIGDLAGAMPPASRLIVLSAAPPSREMASGNLFAPVVIAGDGITPGLLTSGTTHRPGLISNMDIAPMVLSLLGVNSYPGMAGRPAFTRPVLDAGVEPYKWVQEQARDMIFVHRARPLLLKSYVLLQIILVCTGVLNLFTPFQVHRWMMPVLLSLTAVPLSMLVLGGVQLSSLPLYAGAAVALTVLVAAAAFQLGRGGIYSFVWLSLATTAALTLDLLSGSQLMQRSPLGYDGMGGARFYGIGNEYMGVLIGATIIGLTGLYQFLNRLQSKIYPLLAMAMAGTVFILASPSYGINVGGTVAGIAGFGITLMALRRIRFTLYTTMLLGGIISASLLALGFYDMHRSVAVQTHLGRAANLLLNGGQNELALVLERKMAMNWKLIKYTVWSRVLLVTMAAMGLMLFRPLGLFNAVRDRNEPLTHGFLGVFVAGITALVCNDSGIVAAATMMIFSAAPYLYLSLERKGAIRTGN